MWEQLRFSSRREISDRAIAYLAAITEMHQVQTLTTLVITITADTREDTEVTEDMEAATVASAVMAVVTNAPAPPSDCSRPRADVSSAKSVFRKRT